MQSAPSGVFFADVFVIGTNLKCVINHRTEEIPGVIYQVSFVHIPPASQKEYVPVFFHRLPVSQIKQEAGGQRHPSRIVFS